MIHYVTLPDWIIWIACIALQCFIMRKAWGRLPFMASLMLLTLGTSCIEFAALFGSQYTYAKVYFLLRTPEYALMGLTAIELCCKLQPSGTRRVIRLGPITVAGPMFFSIVIMIPLAILTMWRMSELAYTLAALLLLLCLLFEEVAAPLLVARVAWAFLSLLGLLIAAIELLYRFGNHGAVNRAVPVAWLLGLGVVALSLRPKRGASAVEC